MASTAACENDNTSLFIIQHTLRSCKLLLLFTAMLVLLCFEPAQDTKLDSYTSRSSTSVQHAFDLLTYLEQKLVAMTLHSAQLLQIHTLRSKLSFTLISTCELADVFDSDVVC